MFSALHNYIDRFSKLKPVKLETPTTQNKFVNFVIRVSSTAHSMLGSLQPSLTVVASQLCPQWERFRLSNFWVSALLSGVVGAILFLCWHEIHCTSDFSWLDGVWFFIPITLSLFFTLLRSTPLFFNRHWFTRVSVVTLTNISLLYVIGAVWSPLASITRRLSVVPYSGGVFQSGVVAQGQHWWWERSWNRDELLCAVRARAEDATAVIDLPTNKKVLFRQELFDQANAIVKTWNAGGVGAANNHFDQCLCALQELFRAPTHIFTSYMGWLSRAVVGFHPDAAYWIDAHPHLTFLGSLAAGAGVGYASFLAFAKLLATCGPVAAAFASQNTSLDNVWGAVEGNARNIETCSNLAQLHGNSISALTAAVNLNDANIVVLTTASNAHLARHTTVLNELYAAAWIGRRVVGWISNRFGVDFFAP